MSNSNNKNQVAIIDFGGQYTKVIDRRVRELGLNTQIYPRQHPAEELQEYGALILSGSPDSVTKETVTENDKAIFALQIPLLGICYGMQLMNFIFGGTLARKDIREDGQDSITIDNENSGLFQGLGSKEKVLLTHGDSVDQVADGFIVTATSSKSIIAAIESPSRNLYAVQFHPEVDLTENGQKMLSNFLFNIAKLHADYTIEDREQIAINYIRGMAGEEKHVLVLVSGGVDSSVCAALIAKALPTERIHCLHIDNGFMRKNESNLVIQALRAIGIKVHFVDAKQQFYTATYNHEGDHDANITAVPLSRTTNPEEKRKIIGDTFMRVAQQAVESFQLNFENTLLAQGTLRPDLIESAGFVSQNATVIKTHHNDTALVRKLREAGRVIEPLRDYHKDEVRLLGKSLGLPDQLVWRQPFPGPGLSVRLLCSDGQFDISMFSEIEESLRSKFNGYNVNLLPVRSVGVQGDGRSYGVVAALSTSYSSISEIDWEGLLELAKDIPKFAHQVNRVVFGFGDPSLYSTPRLVETHMDEAVIHVLQEVDDIANSVLLSFHLTTSISQMPVVLLPLSFSNNCNSTERSVVLRPFCTNDFMTGVPAIPGSPRLPFEALSQMVNKISEVNGISRVLFDITPKPPATTEWE